MHARSLASGLIHQPRTRAWTTDTHRERRPELSASGTTPRPGLFEVFADPGYRRLWSARTVSQWGDTFNVVALVLLVYDLTGSGLGVSGVVVAEILPVLLLAPFAGPWVDRWPRVRVMVGSDLFRLVLAVVLAVWHDDPVGVYAVAFGMSVGAVFFNPAASSVLPALVKKDALVAANSGIWTAAVLSQVVLAPLAGLLVVALGYGPAFAVNALSYAISAVVLRGLRVPGPLGPVQRRRFLAEAREGVAVLVRHRLLRALAVGQFLAAVSAGATSALLVVLAEEHLGVRGRGYGLLIAAIGVGAALGPLVLLARARPGTRVRGHGCPLAGRQASVPDGRGHAGGPVRHRGGLLPRRCTPAGRRGRRTGREPGRSRHVTATAWQHNRRTHRPQASDVLGLRLNVWTSIIVFLCAATYFAVSARLRPGRACGLGKRQQDRHRLCGEQAQGGSCEG